MGIHKDQVSDNFHGVQVNDPFRRLEDVQSLDTKNWLEEQHAHR